MTFLKINFYQQLFYKNFFIDKFLVKNIFQCSNIKNFTIQLIPNLKIYSKVNFSKIVLLFYLLTGQKPKIFLKNCFTKGLTKKRITHFLITLNIFDFLRNFIIFKQLTLVTSSNFFLPKFSHKIFTLFLNYKFQDDDILLQELKISEFFKYQIFLKVSSRNFFHFQSFLIGLKIPCQIS